MTRIADYVAQELVRGGVRHVFMVTGGGAMHLNDGFGRCKGIEVICCHHEQACAMAAESYARLSGRLGVINVTTGPGGINALNGVFGAWTDSIPVLIISGQVKRETTLAHYALNGKLRQLGDQEVDIIAMVKSITKYSVMITDPESIRYHLEKAVYLARHGRPGPVWLDIPIDVQATNVDESGLTGYDAATEPGCLPVLSDLDSLGASICERLRGAKRPVFFVGNGVRVGGAQELFLRLADHLQIPVVTGWNAHDLIWNEHPLFVGRPGIIGDRPGNFAVQNSDLLLVLGSRLNLRQVSYNWKAFARGAFKIVVDIDPYELQKPTFRSDLPVIADARTFCEFLLAQPIKPQAAHRDWLNWCRARRQRYPVVLPEYWESTENVNPYCFVEELFRRLPEHAVVVTGDGTACVTTFQAAVLKRGQRLYTNSGCASMGYDLPAAVGASLALGRSAVVCLAGDGSIQMNLQELQTIIHHRLPVKIFILNNRGYHSIRQTQRSYFPDNVVGCGTESGLSFPDFAKLAMAYGYGYRAARNHRELPEAVGQTLAGSGAQICEVFLDLNQQFAPKVASRQLEDGRMVSAPLEDMAPFLSREELGENMLIPMVDS